MMEMEGDGWAEPQPLPIRSTRWPSIGQFQ